MYRFGQRTYPLWHRRGRHRGNAPVPSGPAWLARPDEHELARAGRLAAAVGRDRGQVQRPGSPRRLRGVAPQACCSIEGRQTSCLSFCLIHPRPGPFTSVRPGHVRARRGRWRTSVNTGQHCWKACWGQPLRSSNLLSSATSDQAIHQAGHGPVRMRSLICSLIHSTYIGIKPPKGAGARFWMLSRLWPPPRHSGSEQTSSLPWPSRWVRIFAAIVPGPQRPAE
jgi:hypothetical protein